MGICRRAGTHGRVTGDFPIQEGGYESLAWRHSANIRLVAAHRLTTDGGNMRLKSIRVRLHESYLMGTCMAQWLCSFFAHVCQLPEDNPSQASDVNLRGPWLELQGPARVQCAQDIA